MVEPSKAKLKAYLQQPRIKKYGSPTVSTTQVRQWCEVRKNTPSDEDEAFVLDYYIHAESLNPDDQYLRYVDS